LSAEAYDDYRFIALLTLEVSGVESVNITKYKIVFKLTCYESVLIVAWLVFM